MFVLLHTVFQNHSFCFSSWSLSKPYLLLVQSCFFFTAYNMILKILSCCFRAPLEVREFLELLDCLEKMEEMVFPDGLANQEMLENQ